MTASRRRDAHDSWGSKAKRWEEKPSPTKEAPEEKPFSDGQVNSTETYHQEEQKSGALLKDRNPARSRWADIEVEDVHGSEDWGEGDEGARGVNVTGRRQLGPRGGRRPKFPAAASAAEVTQEPPAKSPAKQEPPAKSPVQKLAPTPAPAPAQPQKQQPKPAYKQAQSQSWNSWGNQDWSGGYWGNEAWEPPSRADMDDCWRKGAGDKPKQSDAWGDDAWGSCRGSSWNNGGKHKSAGGKW